MYPSLLLATNQPKYYSSVGDQDEKNNEEVPVKRLAKPSIWECGYSIVFCNRIKEYCKMFVLIILVLLGVFVASIVIGIIFILINTGFEKTIVLLFGRDVYNKNFPVCSNTVYLSNGCYSTTSTYCT